MSIMFLYSFLILMYVFFNQHLTSSMVVTSTVAETENDNNVTTTAAPTQSPVVANWVTVTETETDDNVTTTAAPTQSPNITKWVLGRDNNYYECQTDKSLIGAEDIRALIDYIYDRQFYKDKIISNYSSQAEVVAEKQSKNIDKIEDLLTKNPSNHLRHIFEELIVIANTNMDPLIKQSQVEVSEKPQLEQEFKNRVYRLRETLHTLRDNKMVCKYDCKNKMSYAVERSMEANYCVSLKHLYTKINSKLSVVVETVKNFAHSLIESIDRKLSKRVNALQRKLEKELLGKAGKSWVKIMKLQNKNHELGQVLSEVYNESLSVEDFGSEIDIKSEVSNRAIEDFSQFCHDCDVHVEPHNSPAENTSTIINYLIKVKYMDVWRAVESHIKSKYVDLYSKLKNLKKYVKDLQEYQFTGDEAAELMNQGRMVLNYLEMISPQITTRRVVETVMRSNDLLNKIEKRLRQYQARYKYITYFQ